MKITFKKELFKNFMKENNLSVTKFCKLCKIDVSVYYKIMNDKTNFRINVLFKIAKVLKIQVYQMFKSED